MRVREGKCLLVLSPLLSFRWQCRPPESSLYCCAHLDLFMWWRFREKIALLLSKRARIAMWASPPCRPRNTGWRPAVQGGDDANADHARWDQRNGDSLVDKKRTAQCQYNDTRLNMAGPNQVDFTGTMAFIAGVFDSSSYSWATIRSLEPTRVQSLSSRREHRLSLLPSCCCLSSLPSLVLWLTQTDHLNV